MQWGGRIDHVLTLETKHSHFPHPLFHKRSTVLRGGDRSTCSGWFAFERGMTIQMTLRLMRAALVVKAHGRTAVWPRATWILPGLSDTSRDTVTPAGNGIIGPVCVLSQQPCEYHGITLHMTQSCEHIEGML